MRRVSSFWNDRDFVRSSRKNRRKQKLRISRGRKEVLRQMVKRGKWLQETIFSSRLPLCIPIFFSPHFFYSRMKYRLRGRDLLFVVLVKRTGRREAVRTSGEEDEESVKEKRKFHFDMIFLPSNRICFPSSFFFTGFFFSWNSWCKYFLVHVLWYLLSLLHVYGFWYEVLSPRICLPDCLLLLLCRVVMWCVCDVHSEKL